MLCQSNYIYRTANKFVVGDTIVGIVDDAN